MNIPQPELLQVLIAFHEAKNLIQAAERLGVSQPAVTQRLQHLQEQVEHPLYAFEGRKKVLTHYGKALYDLAKLNFLQLETDFQNLNRRYASPEQLVLRVAGAKELMGIFSEAIEFAGRMDHRMMPEDQAIAAVESEVADIAISETLVDNAELMSRKFFEGASRIIFHRKAFPSIVSFRDVQDNSELIAQGPCVIHRLQTKYVEKFYKSIKRDVSKLNAKAIFEDWSSILNFVEGGGGYAVVPAYVQPHAKDVRVIEVPHAIIPRSTYYVVFKRKLKKIDSFKKVLNFVVSSS
ncbi:MAG: LysR family transcriptional regulator [Bdellovibrionota bacterium]